MSKINIRESLNRLDLQTDNKYDLRNIYDCSNISDDKKKELAEALNKNASAKEISKLLSEDYDDFDPKYGARYEVDSYYGANYSGLEDDLYTDDFEEVKNWVWEKIQKGGYIEVSDRERGKSVRLDPENYDWESDDSYRVLDNLEELSPLNEKLNESLTEDLDLSEVEEIKSIPFENKRTNNLRGLFSVDSFVFALNKVGLDKFKIRTSRLKNVSNSDIKDAWMDLKKKGWSVSTERDNSLDGFNEVYVFEKITNESMKESYGGYDYYLIEFFVDGRRYEEEYTDTSAREAIERFKEDYSDDDYKIREIYKLTDEGYVGLGYPFIKANESLTEEDYGGAYDIDPEMFWTKDDLIEFSDAVCDKLTEKFGYQYNIADVGAESNNDMYILIEDTTHGIEADVSFRIKMSRIRTPRDLMKYLDTVVSEFVKKFEEEYQYYDFDESLKEDLNEEQLYKIVCKSGATEWPFESALSYEDAEKIVDYYNGRWIDEKGFEWSMEIEEDDESTERVYPFDESLKETIEDGEDFDETEYSDFDDDKVDEGVNFFEDGEEWTWEEKIAGPVNIDFDNWSVWKAKKAVDIRDFIIGKNKEGGYIIDEEPFYKAHEDSPRVYFVVDEDTGFIDWGPVENAIEAQDFLNEKISDWEEETGFRHPMHDDFFNESLQESRAIKNDDDFEVTLHYDDIGNGKAYDYKLGYDEVVAYLKEIAWANGDGPEEANEDEYLEWVMDNFDELADRYESNVLNYFESEASQYEYDHRNDEP